MNNIGNGIFSLILTAYLVTSQVMTLYFWWLWAQGHGFWSSVLIGPLVGEIKGLLWVFFIF